MRMGRLGPGATDAGKAVGLVLLGKAWENRQRMTVLAGLPEQRSHRSPSACRTFIGFECGCMSTRHGGSAIALYAKFIYESSIARKRFPRRGNNCFAFLRRF